MYFFELLMVLVLGITIDGYEDVYWIEDGGKCRRDYVPDICCIHYSNCAEGYDGLTKGLPELCYFSGIQKVYCCVENDEEYDNYSDYGKPPNKNEEEYSHQFPDYPDYSHFSESSQQQPIKKPPQYEPQQPDDVIPPITTKPMPLCYGVAFGTPTTENRFGLDCSKYITTSTQQPPITAANATTIMSDIVTVAVVGGVDAKPLEFPHMALLGYGNEASIEWHCGGTLISETFILTAAHCINTIYGRVAFVSLGVHALMSFTSSVQQFKVRNTYPHPDYARATRYHDIALIEVDNRANITTTGIKPALLHNSMELPAQIFIATGWGATDTDEYSNILQKVNLTYIPFDACSRTYKPRRNLFPQGLIDSWQLCADGGSERRDTCGGDSGGPLQIKSTNNTYTIVGVTSLGQRQCGLVPAVYTRVSNYVQWIESVLQQ